VPKQPQWQEMNSADSEEQPSDDDTEGKLKEMKVLPMFAALENQHLDLAISLSVTEDLAPDYLKENLYKMTSEEIDIVERFLEQKVMHRKGTKNIDQAKLDQLNKLNQDPEEKVNILHLIVLFPQLLKFIQATADFGGSLQYPDFKPVHPVN